MDRAAIHAWARAWCIGVVLFGAADETLAQGKPRVAVSAFENKVKTPWWDPSWRIGEGLAEMLTTELVKTNQFTVVERAAATDVIGEQALGQSGLVTRESAARSGQMLGAQYIVRGAVTEFEDSASGGGAGVQGRNVGIAGRAQNAHLAIDLRLIDATTGQVVASQNVSKLAPSAGGALTYQNRGTRFGGDLFQQTPIGQATRAAIQEALQFVVARTPRLGGPPSLALVKVEGTTAYINAGANAAVRIGDVMQVFSQGEALIDPATGLNLGAVERAIGWIRVTEVHEQFSIGTIQNATAVMRRGDSVRIR